MSRDTNSTRRSFLRSGALFAAPLVPVGVMADDDLKARLAKLENEAAIRDLHQTWLRRINTGARDTATALFADPDSAALDPAVRAIAPDHTGQPDAIVVAPDGRGATGRFHCAVEIETKIAEDCTLAQMALAQGGGFFRRTERCGLEAEYVKVYGRWAIAKVELASV